MSGGKNGNLGGKRMVAKTTIHEMARVERKIERCLLLMRIYEL